MTQIIQKFDIFGIVETHANQNSDLSVDSCKDYSKIRKRSGKKLSGGITVYINDRVKEGVRYIPTQNENILWCKIDRTFFELERDIYLETAYFSPQGYERASAWGRLSP